MSSPETHRRLLKAAVAGLLLVGPAACFRPLYGPTASGAPMTELLAAIDVPDVGTGLDQERLGHELRTELIYNLNGSGQPAKKRFKLLITTSETVQGTTVDSVSGRANAAILNGAANFNLQNFEGTNSLMTGSVRASATYFRSQQRFANLRAAKDAEARAAKEMADEIRQRLAAYFATAQ